MANIKISQFVPLGFSVGNFVPALQELDLKAGGTGTSATLLQPGFAQFKLAGTGFVYSGGNLVGGKITSVNAEVLVGTKFVPALSASSFSIDIAKALANPGTYNPFAGLGIDYDASKFKPTQASPGAEFYATENSDKFIGSIGSDVFAGFGGADTLDGGLNIDFLYGGAGNDTYVVDNARDVVDESLSGSNGTDTIKSAINFSLVNTTYVKGSIENLTLTGTAVTGTGNALANTITGNTLANTLTGAAGNDKLNGGTGIDVLRGGIGNDTYIVDNAKDVVDESVSGSTGIDSVQSTVTYSLANTTYVKGSVENLTLLGTAKINATGNALANILVGNDGSNILTGAVGKDKLTGDLGKDYFDFNAVLETGKTAATRDVITDFSHAQTDLIDLSGIDAKSTLITKLQGANDAFTFLTKEGAAFTKKAGQLHFDQQGTAAAKITIVEGDINGDGKADFQIELTGWHALVKGDFVL